MRALQAIFAAVVLALCVCKSAVAEPLDDGLAAARKSDFATALRLLRPLTEQGNASAQYYLGVMYDKGNGVSRDYAEAVKWYGKAAEQGYAKAQADLEAVHKGVTKAYVNLGWMYDSRQDYAEAVTWFRKAADQGDALGQINFGFMYAQGRGVTQDYVLAHMWFNLAAARGNINGVKYRDLVASIMTPAQIAEAQKLAREWKPK
jgi:TPR repeat protein